MVTERAGFKREMLAEILHAQEAERARLSRRPSRRRGPGPRFVLLGLRLLEFILAGTRRPRRRSSAQRRRSLARRGCAAPDGRLAFDLRPTVLDDVGLLPALERLAQDMTARGDTVVAFAAHGFAEDRLPPEVETVVFRVVQEALTNVTRHAGAATASITVIVADGRVRALVEDDGSGFDTDAPPSPRRSWSERHGRTSRSRRRNGETLVDSRLRYDGRAGGTSWLK